MILREKIGVGIHVNCTLCYWLFTTDRCGRCFAELRVDNGQDFLLTMGDETKAAAEGLHAYLHPEIIEEYRCGRCKFKGDCVAQREITQVPKLLVLLNGRGERLKVNASLQLLFMQYRLVSVIQMQGTSDLARHFMTIRKINNEWVKFDDSRRRYTDIEDEEIEAYVMMYERQDYQGEGSAPDIEVLPNERHSYNNTIVRMGSASPILPKSRAEQATKRKSSKARRDPYVKRRRKSRGKGSKQSKIDDTQKLEENVGDTTKESHPDVTKKPGLKLFDIASLLFAPGNSPRPRIPKGTVQSTEKATEKQKEKKNVKEDMHKQVTLHSKSVSSPFSKKETMPYHVITQQNLQALVGAGKSKYLRKSQIMDRFTFFDKSTIVRLDTKDVFKIQEVAKSNKAGEQKVTIEDIGEEDHEIEEIPAGNNPTKISDAPRRVSTKSEPHEPVPVISTRLKEQNPTKRSDAPRIVTRSQKPKKFVSFQDDEDTEEYDLDEELLKLQRQEQARQKKNKDDLDEELRKLERQRRDRQKKNKDSFKKILGKNFDLDSIKQREKSETKSKVRDRQARKARDRVEHQERVAKGSEVVEEKKGKRRYTFREWKTHGLRKDTKHISMMRLHDDQILPDHQQSTGDCILCHPQYYTESEAVMLSHYIRVHYRHTMEINQRVHLLCKCDDFISRSKITNRNSHHHCPECWAVMEKSKDMREHLRRVHGYTLDTIKKIK